MTENRILPGILFVCLNAFGIALSAGAQTTAPNEWTWIGGSNTANPPGVYGRLGTPAAGNIPGGRDSAATWTDSSGNFWLFGGEAFDANGNFGLLNDLWEFQPSSQEWTWISGSSTLPASCAGSTTLPCGQPGVYGSSGSAAAGNIPGGRLLASYWSDRSGNFWLFGGEGFDTNQNLGELNDLWEFNHTTNQWTWIGGGSTVGGNGGQPGGYGTLGSAAAANIPGGRDSATNWTDKSGQLWIYGGEGFDGQGNYGQLNDLWEFDPITSEWTWTGGSSTLPVACATGPNNGMCGWPAIYGKLGAPATGISPGNRVAAASWTDKSGNFLLFGGLGTVFWKNNDFSEIDQYDLWEFNPSTKQWAWMSGNTTSTCMEGGGGPYLCGQSGIYGTQGTPAIANIPPSLNNATTWTDTSGNLWLFGGAQSMTTVGQGGGLCNDLWVFEPAANEWAWMGGASQFGGGSCILITPGTNGVMGTPAAANIPSGRAGAASWTDSSGNLWLFGGVGYTSSTGFFEVDLNDLWIYQPAAPAPVPSFEVIASPNPINIGAMGTGTPTITTGTTTVNIVAAAGFDALVSLAATTDTMNGVTDITGSFNPATVTGAGSSILTISVTGAAVLIPETIPLTITGSSGGTSQSIQVIVDVTKIGQISAPSFSVPAGTYSTSQTVTITDAAVTEYNNMFIYYTTDGTTPTSSSPVYVNPITVALTTTLKAIAIDPFNDQSAVSSATYTIAPPLPNFSITGSAVSVAPGATTGNTSTISLMPSGGFTGVISLSCAITPTAANDPATCSIPASVTISGSTAQTIILTVNTTSATSVTSALNLARKFFRRSVGGTTLACILLVGIPDRRRRWWSILVMLVLLFSVGGAFGCGGSGNGGAGGSGGNPGTTPGIYVISVTGTSGTITHEGTVSLSVQ
jgi:N-acetylneuraminic acid mutarotase